MFPWLVNRLLIEHLSLIRWIPMRSNEYVYVWVCILINGCHFRMIFTLLCLAVWLHHRYLIKGRCLSLLRLFFVLTILATVGVFVTIVLRMTSVINSTLEHYFMIGCSLLFFLLLSLGPSSGGKVSLFLTRIIIDALWPSDLPMEGSVQYRVASPCWRCWAN